MRPAPGEVMHFSEDPSITEFVPHVARTASDPTAYVWAVGAAHAPGYWFPRQCPRAMAWVAPGTTDVDRQHILGPVAVRVHLVEYGWLRRLQQVRLFAYRFDAADFEHHGDELDPHACVARQPVRPWDRQSRSATCWPCTRTPRSSSAWLTPCGPGGTRWSPPRSASAASGCTTPALRRADAACARAEDTRHAGCRSVQASGTSTVS